MGTLAVVELPLRSGLPKDRIVNTYAIAEANHTPGDLPALALAIQRIYTAAELVVGVTLATQMSPALNRAADACSVKMYNITDHLDGSPHGSPEFVLPFTLPASGPGAPMPEEVALVGTLEAAGRAAQFVEVPDGADPDAAPDRPRQRYTGRVYYGPFNAGVVVADANGMARPTANIQTIIRNVLVRASVEIDDVGVGDIYGLGVWSRKNRAIRGIDNVRTDDAFDTQRRRGASPTAVIRTNTGELVPEVELAV